MQRFNIPVNDYREMAHHFNPARFNADEWVALAKAAGMKYMVFTAKHHDGFSMYRSQITDYNIVDWTPFKHDILRALAIACQKQGMRLGIYYSQREDWDDPDGYGNNWDYDRVEEELRSLPGNEIQAAGSGTLDALWAHRAHLV